MRATMPPRPRPRARTVSVSVADRKQAVADIKAKRLKAYEVAEKLEVSRAAVSQWLKSDAYDSAIKPADQNMRRFHPAEFPEMDAYISQYLELRASKLKEFGVGLSWLGVQLKAKAKAAELATQGIAKYSTFKASPGWFSRLRRRENLKQVWLCGEAGSVDEADAQRKMKDFRRKINGLPRDRVYNADETGSFLSVLTFPLSHIYEITMNYY